MNREHIVQMARDAGLLPRWAIAFTDAEKVERFAAAIRAATKEEDAKICDWLALERDSIGRVSLQMGADAIRASK